MQSFCMPCHDRGVPNKPRTAFHVACSPQGNLQVSRQKLPRQHTVCQRCVGLEATAQQINVAIPCIGPTNCVQAGAGSITVSTDRLPLYKTERNALCKQRD